MGEKVGEGYGRRARAVKAARARWGGVKVVLRVPEDLWGWVQERASVRGVSPEEWLVRSARDARDRLGKGTAGPSA